MPCYWNDVYSLQEANLAVTFDMRRGNSFALLHTGTVDTEVSHTSADGSCKRSSPRHYS